MCEALSPAFPGSKRLFDEAHEDVDSPCDRAQGKRVRFAANSPSGRCWGGPALQQPALHPSTLNALRALFPDMDDQTVTAVLAECGQDIDAAIRRLNRLRIETQADAAAASAQQQQQQQQQDKPEDEQRQHQQQQQQAATACEAAEQAQPSAAAAAAAAQTEQQQQAAANSGGPQTAEQWVDALVGEMAQAGSIPDARARAAKLLQAFESFVAARSSDGGAAAANGGASGAGSGAGTPRAGGSLQARLEEAARENAILKRAVQIQNARIQEAAAREGELASLKTLLAQYQERMRHLELSNYSLALHLQKATGDAPVAPGHRPPDVY